jgi:ABC-type multidrug transport system ATPase subunit
MLVGTFLLVLGVYLQTLHYQEPWLFCRRARQRLRGREQSIHSLSQPLALTGNPVYSGGQDRFQSMSRLGADGRMMPVEPLDEDVAAERRRLQKDFEENARAVLALPASERRNCAGGLAVRVVDLHKTYEVQSAATLAKSLLTGKCSASRATKVAVGPDGPGEGLFFGVNYGETLGLLGTNGAGKSTTISILCGLLNGTSGTSMVGNYDSGNEMDRQYIYRMLGACPQFDTVWADLSVRETLLCYARIRGVRAASESAVVQRVANMVDLDGDSFDMVSVAFYVTRTSFLRVCTCACMPTHSIWRVSPCRSTLFVLLRRLRVRVCVCVRKPFAFFHFRRAHFHAHTTVVQAASELSGGMKRRLSIAISLIGDPKVWMLDEPTTGLDPETRRQVWRIISRQKSANRAIIITTHSMTEADTLATRVAIMNGGKMRCIGSQLHLKNRFGKGYSLKCALSEAVMKRDAAGRREAARALTEFVRQKVCATAVIGDDDDSGANKFGGAKKDENDVDEGAFMRIYSLPRDAELDLSAAVSVLEANKQKLGIIEWGLSQSSLEEVFMRMAGDGEQAAALSKASALQT